MTEPFFSLGINQVLYISDIFFICQVIFVFYLPDYVLCSTVIIRVIKIIASLEIIILLQYRMIHIHHCCAVGVFKSVRLQYGFAQRARLVPASAQPFLGWH